MEIVPILAALRRNGIGALLIGMQIALTLAIVCNSLSIIQQRLQRTQRGSGLDEGNIFTFRNQWAGRSQDLPVRIREDLATLRTLPGVIDAAAVESYPLNGQGPSAGVFLRAEQKQASATAADYMVDDHGIAAFGLRLTAGRNFTAAEIHDFRPSDTYSPSVMIVSSALAKSLFPNGDALGQSVYFLSSQRPARIVGIVERLQTPLASSSWGEQFVENSALLPTQLIDNEQSYVVRTRPGQRDAVMRAAPRALIALNPARVIDDILPFSDTRAHAYRADYALSIILGTVSGLLLMVTALGVIGLTTYWVAQRRRQIGVRRALGARRIDILQYFHSENLIICAGGGVVGIALGLGGNLWLATSLQLTRMGVGFMALSAAVVLALSQLAVIWPAVRATRIPPAIAARGG
jgi:putative ABC transport system permease protein